MNRVRIYHVAQANFLKFLNAIPKPHSEIVGWQLDAHGTFSFRISCPSFEPVLKTEVIPSRDWEPGNSPPRVESVRRQTVFNEQGKPFSLIFSGETTPAIPLAPTSEPYEFTTFSKAEPPKEETWRDRPPLL